MESEKSGDQETEEADAEKDLFKKLFAVHRKVLRRKDVTLCNARSICDEFRTSKIKSIKKLMNKIPSVFLLLSCFVLGVTMAVLGQLQEDSNISGVMWESRCVLQNNFLVMEATRPETDCRICEGVRGAVELSASSVTRETFSRLAYASRPVLVRGVTANWTAMHVFGFEYFRHVYEETKGAYEAVEKECQFFPFATEFTSLRQVFAMSEARANFEQGQDSWYIGWSNCDPRVAAQLRQHYQRPHFLPENADASAIDWIFMGGTGPGASMHLDYVSRPSWQAQVSGSKTWHLLPPPECEHLCTGFSITVNTGDMVLIDTNQWYHDTRVNPGKVSITIGSEYG